METEINPMNTGKTINVVNLGKSQMISKCKQFIIQLLNVVREPQKPIPINNLKGDLNLQPTTNPKIKLPIRFTIKSLLICHLINAPGIAPDEISKNLFIS